MASRPVVSLDNHEAIYNYYEAHEQSRLFARLAHAVFARVFRLDLSTEPGAEAAITDAVGRGTRLIVSPNHITGDDQYVVVSLAQRLPALHALRAQTFIPAEPSLFMRKGLGGRFLRMAVDELGALPTFRREDIRRQGLEGAEGVEELYRACIERAGDIQFAKLVSGKMMAGFWEGTRNRVDHRIVQPLKKGIAHTAITASRSVDVAVVPVGIYYGSEPEDYRRPDVPGKHHPHVHVGNPIPVNTESPEALVAQLHPALQACVDVVVDRAGGMATATPDAA